MHSRLVAVSLLILVIGLSSNLGHTETSVKVYSFGRITYPAISSYENVTTHEGDLIIGGTQTFLIENCTYIQTGSIRAQDRGVLLTRNARIVINQTHGPEFGISFFGQSFLDMRKCELVSTHIASVGIVVGDEAQAFIEELTIAEGTWSYISCHRNSNARIVNSSLWELNAEGNSTVTVTNSTIDCEIVLHLLTPDVFEIANLKPGLHTHWNLHENETTTAIYELSLENTWVKAWSIYAEHNCQATISNSSIRDIILSYTDVAAAITDIHPGFIENATIDSIALRNLRVIGWNVVLSGRSAIVVNNCSLGVTCDWNENPNSTVSIINSTIGLRFSHYSGIMFLSNTSCSMLDTIYSSVSVNGDALFNDAYILWWMSTNIIRNYNLVVNDATEHALANATITVTKLDNLTVLNGITDDQGKIDFNITFTDSNYTDTLRLEADKGNLTGTVYVGFLSNTPVVLKMRYLNDLNGDGAVNILDIFIVANAFGSKPGDANWNATADLNKDGTVNILDIFAVARDFGKTV